MGGGPRVSVLLPCRDAAEHLPQAIASVEAQTFGDYEVLAVDDGSRDATGPLLAAWAERNARVRTIRTGARGIVPALQLAAGAARGELLARMDADDVALPTRLAAQVALLDSSPQVAACGTGVRYFPGERVRAGARRYEAWLNSLVGPDDLERDLFIECPIAHPALLVRRGAFERVGGYRELDWPEDYDLVLRLWEAGHRLANVPEVLLRWREGPTRASRTDPRYSPDAFRRCKAHFLVRTLLVGRAGAVVIGGGPLGKAFGRELLRRGCRVAAFADVNPRRIGQRMHGAPVIPNDEIDRYRDCFAVAAVGSAAAREQIRGELRARGWREMIDFCAVA